MTDLRLLTRLRELLPVLSTWGTALADLDAEGLGLALSHHEVPWAWTWLDAPGFVLEGVSIAQDARVLVYPEGPAPCTLGDLRGLEVIDGVWVARDHRVLGATGGAYRGFVVEVPVLLPDVIHFYSVVDVYGEFSNFAPFPLRIDGALWRTSEHYFQAQKFKERKLRERIRRAKTPGEAARMGRSRKNPLRRDWESAKLNVMRKAVRAKFEQHRDLAALLVQTDDATIIEHTPNDAYWGDGGDGSGQNWLGRILMDVRGELVAG